MTTTFVINNTRYEYYIWTRNSTTAIVEWMAMKDKWLDHVDKLSTSTGVRYTLDPPFLTQRKWLEFVGRLNQIAGVCWSYSQTDPNDLAITAMIGSETAIQDWALFIPEKDIVDGLDSNGHPRILIRRTNPLTFLSLRND
jgi:hypothetical protein